MIKENFLKGEVVTISKTPYIKELCRCSIGNYRHELISGDNSHVSYKKAIVPAVGEYLERENMMFRNLFSSKKITCFNLSSKSKSDFEKDYLLMKEVFSDSCGLATHPISMLSIKNGLDEFLERQFFIFNYLSKSSGEYIPKSILKCFIKPEYEELNFFNISLVKGYYVLIAYGEQKGRFIIGLGASIVFEIALEKCLKELNQFLGMYCYDIVKDENRTKETLDYMDYFLMLDNKELMDTYAYLYDENKIFNDVLGGKSGVQGINYEKIISEIWRIYGIDTQVSFIRTRYSEAYFKEVKIFSLNWFPTLNPRVYKESTYLFIESKTGVKLDRNCNFIPFP